MDSSTSQSCYCLSHNLDPDEVCICCVANDNKTVKSTLEYVELIDRARVYHCKSQDDRLFQVVDSVSCLYNGLEPVIKFSKYGYDFGDADDYQLIKKLIQNYKIPIHWEFYDRNWNIKLYTTDMAPLESWLTTHKKLFRPSGAYMCNNPDKCSECESIECVTGYFDI